MAGALVRVAVLVAALAITPRPVTGQPRRRVHVDNLDPTKVAQYEQARREWLAWIVEHKAVDPWGGLFLQVGKARFLVLRPFTRYADLDPSPAPVQIDRQVQARYNERCDAVVATVVVQHERLGDVEKATLGLLGGPTVMRWTEVTLGL